MFCLHFSYFIYKFAQILFKTKQNKFNYGNFIALCVEAQTV